MSVCALGATKTRHLRAGMTRTVVVLVSPPRVAVTFTSIGSGRSGTPISCDTWSPPAGNVSGELRSSGRPPRPATTFPPAASVSVRKTSTSRHSRPSRRAKNGVAWAVMLSNLRRRQLALRIVPERDRIVLHPRAVDARQTDFIGSLAEIAGRDHDLQFLRRAGTRVGERGFVLSGRKAEDALRDRPSATT